MNVKNTEYKATLIDGMAVIHSYVTKNGRTYVNFVAECATMDDAVVFINRLLK